MLIDQTRSMYDPSVSDLCDPQLTINGPCRPLAEAIPKERAPGLPVFRQALACVPFILPEHWTSGQLVDDLPGVIARISFIIAHLLMSAPAQCFT